MALPHRILPLLRAAPQLSYMRRLTTAPPRDPQSKLDPNPRNDTPPLLSRPIGLARPPRAGENTGVDTRTWAQRRKDFRDWDKHLEKRADLTRQFAKSYFADFSHISAQHRGKSFLSPPLLFRADKALFFPNLVGRTLADPSPQDTTAALAGHVAVVAVFSTAWAQAQCATFLDALPLPPAVRRVDVHVELGWLKAGLVRLFMPRIRAALPADRHALYFLVRRGLSERVRHEMGFWNGRVGYVYLLDWECRIRWAGSGNAGVEEKAALVRGVARLQEEWQRIQAARPVQEEEKEKEKKLVDDDDDF